MPVTEPRTMKMTSSLVKSGDSFHRKCVLRIPKCFSDAYPEGQIFEVAQVGDVLVYRPEASTLHEEFESVLSRLSRT